MAVIGKTMSILGMILLEFGVKVIIWFVIDIVTLFLIMGIFSRHLWSRHATIAIQAFCLSDYAVVLFILFEIDPRSKYFCSHGSSDVSSIMSSIIVVIVSHPPYEFTLNSLCIHQP